MERKTETHLLSGGERSILMTLTDHEIKQMFSTFVPYAEHRDEDLINPASFDVRIGNTIRLEKSPKPMGLPQTFGELLTSEEYRKQHFFGKQVLLQDEEIYWLEPGEFILVSMLERIHVPDNHTMSFYLKSSRAREGFEHANAGWIDPGWRGILTMEIKNNLRFNYLPIYKGLRIGQMKVEHCTTNAVHPYKGRYQGAGNVETAKPADYDYRPTKEK